MEGKESSLDQFFKIASRWLIVFPIVIVLIAFVLRFKDSYKTIQEKKTVVPTPTTAPVANNLLRMFTTSTGEAKLNLTDSFYCQYSDKTASITAQFKNKKMYVHFEQGSEVKNIVMRDDCVHVWEQGNYSGERFCGIGPYLGMAEQFMSLGLINFSNIIDTVSGYVGVKTLPISTDGIQKLVNSCKKNDSLDPSLFEIPQNVLFKNTKKP